MKKIEEQVAVCCCFVREGGVVTTLILFCMRRRAPSLGESSFFLTRDYISLENSAKEPFGDTHSQLWEKWRLCTNKKKIISRSPRKNPTIKRDPFLTCCAPYPPTYSWLLIACMQLSSKLSDSRICKRKSDILNVHFLQFWKKGERDTPRGCFCYCVCANSKEFITDGLKKTFLILELVSADWKSEECGWWVEECESENEIKWGYVCGCKIKGRFVG